eukprot:TRINITY_DN47261_c0_g1_i1.p2 TRINITY_DN47261_c0_g1~~TRINITY_DN47261_c0_g1_i1.p2  ORF type:complete len:304 (+),score=52.73 TRINITY_DN47261_c0_g1_i1:80-991(+)
MRAAGALFAALGLPVAAARGIPTMSPTASPQGFNTWQPSAQPSAQPTGFPTRFPTQYPTGFPTWQPSLEPSAAPTNAPVPCEPRDSIVNLTWSGPNDPVATRFVNPMPWLDGDQPTTIGWPSGTANSSGYLHNGYFYKFGDDKCIPAGTQFCARCHSEFCNVYIFLFHQPPVSSPTNGGLPSILPSEGWTPGGACAPKFWYNDCKYPTVAFRKTLDCNEEVCYTLDSTMSAAYLSMAATSAVDCTDNNRQASESACLDTPPGVASTCKWVNDECVDHWCPPGPRRHTGIGQLCPPPDLDCPAV